MHARTHARTDGRTCAVPEGPADAKLPRHVGRLQQGGGPRPLRADDGGDQPRLDAAPRRVEVLARDVRPAVLGCGGAWVWVCVRRDRIEVVVGDATARQARHAPSSQTRSVVTMEKAAPKPERLGWRGDEQCEPTDRLMRALGRGWIDDGTGAAHTYVPRQIP